MLRVLSAFVFFHVTLNANAAAPGKLLNACHGLVCAEECIRRYKLWNTEVCEGNHCACNINHTCSQPADCENNCTVKDHPTKAHALCPDHRCRCVLEPSCQEEKCIRICKFKFSSIRGIKGVCDGNECYCKDPKSGGTMHGPSKLITALIVLTTMVRMPSLGQGMLHALVMPATLLGFVATQLGLGSRVTAV